MSGNCLLITGANGLLGRRCLELLATRTDGPPTIVATWHTRNDHLSDVASSRVRLQRCDLADRRSVGELFEQWRFDRVVHAAAVLPSAETSLAALISGNVLATGNVAECAARQGARMVYCSSISVYGSTPCPPGGWREDAPTSPGEAYGWSKQAGESAVRLSATHGKLSAVALRLAGIHGKPRTSGVIYNMLTAALEGRPLRVSDSKQRFQLLFLEDAARAVIAALEIPLASSFECINVASHEFASVSELAHCILGVCGSSSEIQYQESAPQSAQVMNLEHMSRLGLECSLREERLRQSAAALRS